MKSQGDGDLEGVQIPVSVVSHDVSKECLLVAEMEIVLDAVVYIKCAVSVVPPEVLEMPVLLPLSPDKVASVMHLVIGALTDASREVFLVSPGPPDPPLDDLPDEVEVVSLAYKVVEVALPDNGLHVPVLFVENAVKFLKKLLIRLLHEFTILKASVVQHPIDSRGINVEKLKQLDVLVV